LDNDGYATQETHQATHAFDDDAVDATSVWRMPAATWRDVDVDDVATA
jgi:hypothetical protein